MRVLHVIDSLGRGGAEQLLVTLLPALGLRGVNVGVVVKGGPMDLAPDLAAHGVPVFRLQPRHRWNLIGLALDVARIARRERADVLHAHLYFSAIGTALVRLCGLAPVRSCVTFHNLAYAGANRPSLGLALRRKLAGFLYRSGMDRCLAVSQAVADHYRQVLRLPAVKVLPNPVNLTLLKNVAHEVSGGAATRDACRIVLPGRIVHEKGHGDLLDAMALLAADRPALHLVIAGDGPLREAVSARVITLGLANAVTFTGALEHEAMMRVVAAADIVCVPSRFEGFGLTALEAMALGRAVVASSAGGLPETVGSAGVLFPAGDPAALAAAIARLAGDPELRARLGSAAVERAAQFDQGAIAERLVDFYRSAVLGQTRAVMLSKPVQWA